MYKIGEGWSIRDMYNLSTSVRASVEARPFQATCICACMLKKAGGVTLID